MRLNFQYALRMSCLAASLAAMTPSIATGQVVQPGVADVFGGYPSDHIIVQVQPGIAPTQLPDGRWTFKSADAAAKNAAPSNQQIQAIAAITAAHHASAIAPAFTQVPMNNAIAAQHGLDRYFIILVPQGSNAPLLRSQLAPFNATFASVELDGIGGLAATIPNDPSFAMQQWNMNNTGQGGGTPDADIDAPEAWDITQGSSTLTLAMLDTGVQANHPDLLGKILSGWNIVLNNNNTDDLNGHGTHTTGIAAANTNNAVGVAGVNWNVKILPVVVVNSGGSGTELQCANGITWATDHGANIISMSLQYYTGTTALADAAAYAYDSGVLPIAATGNGQPAGTIAYPAKFPKCMAVGGTDRFDAISCCGGNSSNTGPEIDVTAPGKEIYSTWKGSSYTTLTGTSMATPHVSGLATLIKTINPALGPADIEAIIKNTAEDKGAVGFDVQYGWGRINAYFALLAAAPPCPGNINGDSTVNAADLLAVINSWGPCVGCAADIAPSPHDGVVNSADLLAVINGWGPCP